MADIELALRIEQATYPLHRITNVIFEKKTTPFRKKFNSGARKAIKFLFKKFTMFPHPYAKPIK